MTTETGTPLQRLISVLSLGSPSVYRDHTYINGESMYFPTGRVYGGQVIAQSLIAASKRAAFDPRLFHRPGRHPSGSVVRRGDAA